MKHLVLWHTKLTVVVYEVKGCFFAYMDYTLVSQASQEEIAKQKEALANEMGNLRTELQKARDDHDRQLLQVVVLTEEVAKYEDYTGTVSYTHLTLPTKRIV